MSDIFYTIASPSEGKYTEKMSRFLSFAFPVKTAQEAKEKIGLFSNKYHNARHVCWAYMVGPARTDFMSNDNGEPSGTAGKPILGQINSFGLTDVLIIVVRYFGGIKLGTSGLIGAYREAARLALDAATIIECHQTDLTTFTFPYLAMNDVMKVAKMRQVTIVNQCFDNSCRMTIKTNSDDTQQVLSRLLNIDGVTLT